MSAAQDPELVRLLILELSRHLVALEATPEVPEESRRALHALKGSAGLAGEVELAEILKRHERRLREGDPRATADAVPVVRSAIARLSNGQRAIGSSWPEPPPDLAPRPIDPPMRAQYVAEVNDRLAQIDAALASTGDPVDAAAHAYRQVHTMKGAASAAGDEPMSWFCHGLEERLEEATTGDAARAALGELGRWRAILGALLDDPEVALRALGQRGRASIAPAARASTRPLDDDGRAIDDATIRVSAASVDRLLDRLVTIGLARERIAGQVEAYRDLGGSMRRMRTDLSDALRLIGPPRPWGASAAALGRVSRAAQELGALSDRIEQAAGDMRGGDHLLRDGVGDAKRELTAMRQTPIRSLFQRVATAIAAEARRSERAVDVRMIGADETIDRRLAELLVEPCLQMARNAVAHGIEPPDARARSGKPPVGTIVLAARRIGPRLRVTVADDGAGVDVGALRRRAIETGAVAAAIAEAADDDTLLALLFVPGFSTRATSDLIAGRGLGLDIVLVTAQRLGGAVRLSSRRGEGFSAWLEVPIETGFACVVWVTAAGDEYALPVAQTRRVVARRDVASSPPHLAACLEARASGGAPLCIELAIEPDDLDDRRDADVSVGVDAVGATEEVLVRPLAPLAASMGPYAGAILREDGSLRLVVDVVALAARARALGGRRA